MYHYKILYIQQRIEAACRRAKRDANEITLIGASKTVEVARLKGFLDAGLNDLGENYIQEGVAKIEELQSEYPRLRWHFIGALQSNKAREAVQHFDIIHSMDRISLAKSLNKEAAKINKIQDVLLQVNIGEEDSKSGCAPNEVQSLAARCAEFPNLRVCGLMTLPPFFEEAEKSRPYFRQMRELLVAARSSTASLGNELSIGMSRDFGVAIEEGATMIRLGTVLFGAR